jgi:predicted transcriptional regulator
MSTLRKIRKNILGITQKELADLCAVDQGTVSRWEQGTLEPRLSDLKKIREKAASLGATLDDSDFFDDAETGVAA